MGTGYPLDPPLDRHKVAPGQELAPGVGGLHEEKGGVSRRIPRIPALQVPPRHPRGRRVGPHRAPPWEFQFRHNGQFYFPVFLNTLNMKYNSSLAFRPRSREGLIGTARRRRCEA